VALFVVVPITLSLGTVADLPLGRLVIFEAFAVNAGSAISPIGNPQNLFLWQVSGASIPEFLWAMMPLCLGLMFMLLFAVTVAFSNRPITVKPLNTKSNIHRPLLYTSLLLYPVFLILVDQGFAMVAAIAILVLFSALSRDVLLGID